MEVTFLDILADPALVDVDVFELRIKFVLSFGVAISRLWG
jgi:hypothetical protein